MKRHTARCSSFVTLTGCSNALKEKARKDIEREKVQARSEMKDAIVEVAFEAAKQIVNKELDETAHKQYVDDFIEHAGDESWQA